MVLKLGKITLIATGIQNIWMYLINMMFTILIFPYCYVYLPCWLFYYLKLLSCLFIIIYERWTQTQMTAAIKTVHVKAVWFNRMTQQNSKIQKKKNEKAELDRRAALLLAQLVEGNKGGLIGNFDPGTCEGRLRSRSCDKSVPYSLL